MTPEEIVARLIYRDGLMLVIDKPAGLAVHKGPKGGESLEDYFGALRFGLPRPPALAHRLDRDTSGCLVLGRHRKALAALGRLFKSGQVGKTYWAVVTGGPPQDEGRIELPLGRKDATRGWWMKHDPSGQPAVTTWKVMGRTRLPSAGSDESHDVAWLALEPLTGRTHQLRDSTGTDRIEHRETDRTFREIKKQRRETALAAQQHSYQQHAKVLHGQGHRRER